jgi:4-hydroxy-4-methyl-2-oxoglutarate aldolase
MVTAMIKYDLKNVAERFSKLYVPAVCDVLDDYELRHQYVDPGLRPLHFAMKVAGPAFTIEGRQDSTRDITKRMGPRVIDQFTPGVVAVYDTSGDTTTGVWGELWSAGASRRGCVGAVVDGGIRDTAYIRSTGFPIFHRFTSPADAVGRFNIVDFNCPVTIGGVRVEPGDYVFGDEDGIVIIPSSLTLEVLEKAERVLVRESKIRTSLGEGKALADLYLEHGKF